MEGLAHELSIQLWNEFAHSLESINRCSDDVLGSPMAIMPQLPRGVIHSLLGGSDVMGYAHESFRMPLARAAKQLVMQEALHC